MSDTASTLIRPHRLTVADFHRMGEAGILDEDSRVELIEGQLVDMPPIDPPHASAVGRLTNELVPALGERAVVWVQNPIVLFEVLSPSTERYDRGVKFARYRSIPTLQHYVLVAQDVPRIEHHRREGDSWVRTELVGRTGRLALDALDVTLAMAAIYEDIAV